MHLIIGGIVVLVVTVLRVLAAAAARRQACTGSSIPNWSPISPSRSPAMVALAFTMMLSGMLDLLG